MELFVYGTLLFPELMEALTGRRFAMRPARLPGHRRGRVSGEISPGVVRDACCATDGAVCSGLDPARLSRLDRFEGSLYVRRRATVLAGGEPRHAFVYVVPGARAHRVGPAEWDEQAFAALHLPRLLRDYRAEARRLSGPSRRRRSGSSRSR